MVCLTSYCGLKVFRDNLPVNGVFEYFDTVFAERGVFNRESIQLPGKSFLLSGKSFVYSSIIVSFFNSNLYGSKNCCS
jgi:hypothetical protein